MELGNHKKELQELAISMNDYLLRIPQGCDKIAELLREGKREEAYRSIFDFIEGVDWIIRSATILEDNHYKIEIDKVKNNEILLEVSEAIDKKDDIMLADLFEYEVSQVFQNAIVLEMLT